MPCPVFDRPGSSACAFEPHRRSNGGTHRSSHSDGSTRNALFMGLPKRRLPLDPKTADPPFIGLWAAGLSQTYPTIAPRLQSRYTKCRCGYALALQWCGRWAGARRPCLLKLVLRPTSDLVEKAVAK